MSDLTRDQYMAAIRATGRIENPTIEQMHAVCPHLTREQVIKGLTGKGSCYIALPPVLIKCAFQIADYDPGDAKWSRAPSFTARGYSGRTLESYTDGLDHAAVSHKIHFVDEAIAYAENNWPGHLIFDNWVEYLTVYVEDPNDQNKDGDPRTKSVIDVVLGRDWNEVRRDHHKPDWAVWDDAIVYATVDPLEGSELNGDRSGFMVFNCAHCGGGLMLSSCHHCGEQFTDNQFRREWRTPLAPKLVELLRNNGHVFAVNPDRLF